MQKHVRFTIKAGPFARKVRGRLRDVLVLLAALTVDAWLVFG
ncbi:MAG: hypothetical protein ACRDP6_13825 [Actinoallomurus sp.]